ncbi:actin-binding LIM protein 1 isoform X3 [Hydra vulgaris]|uniref:Actin-binding LIM protein 1 isoform X3 n=1 Tax=Hydra vulgaris TaxID=6087 RepID=A0ABM4BKF4_HYDVU
MVQNNDLAICYTCFEQCTDVAVFAQDRCYHQNCFTCKQCNINLSKSGYFFSNNNFYCTEDYSKLFGSKCSGCQKFVEGEVILAVEEIFHPECFDCVYCGKLFPPNVKILYDGSHFMCEGCNIQDKYKTKEIKSEITESSINSCAGCHNVIKSGQALLALEKQWHLWCFSCFKCGCLLAGEYMGRNGVPYCEQDYQSEFGVSCSGCGGYITGKVLQAGEKHYHPHCARCAKCTQMFGEGEEMYLQGSDIWHPHCSEEYQRENTPKEQRKEHEYKNGNNLSELVIRDNSSKNRSSQNSNATNTQSFDLTTSNIKTSGFRSVKPPFMQELPNENGNDEPYKPPPPRRSSSNSWQTKYTPILNGPTPFQKSSETKFETNFRQRPLSYIESAANKQNGGDSSRPKSTLYLSTNGEISPGEKPERTSSFKKGDGVNKLQLRMSQRAEQKPNQSSENDSIQRSGSLSRTKRMDHLTDREFYDVFEMSREKFATLPKWKQEDLKKTCLL